MGAVNLNAWNAGVCLAFLCIVCWWRSDGRFWWERRGLNCEDCGRALVNCSCAPVIFEPWEEDDDAES